MRSAYGPKVRNALDLSDEPSLTKQSFKQECDINNIMAKYQRTGAITHVKNNKAMYGFASSDSFTESMNIVATAQTMFNELPSSIRSKFKNDPARFLDFVQDEANADELVALGLANAPIPESGPIDVNVVSGLSDPAPNPPPAE